MQKILISLIGLIIGVVISFIWIYRGYKIGGDEWEIEKEKEIKGKVARMYKPETEKVYHIYFADGSEYIPSFWGLDEKIEIGDSIYKAKGSYRLIIFKKCDLQDTLMFEGGNNFYR